MVKLKTSFYRGTDVVQIARDLVGKYLYSSIDGLLTGGIIVETEAYRGADDRACHAYQNKRTPRTETMLMEGGIAYVYLCYGIHPLFNVVTNCAGQGDAVLIRGLEPTCGVEHMLKRRKYDRAKYQLTAGPGCLSVALGINTSHDRTPLNSDSIWISDRDEQSKAKARIYSESDLQIGTRVGMTSAGPDAKRPWRFSVPQNKWVSRGKGS